LFPKMNQSNVAIKICIKYWAHLSQP
jgi:hypothetical protein